MLRFFRLYESVDSFWGFRYLMKTIVISNSDKKELASRQRSAARRVTDTKLSRYVHLCSCWK